MVDSKSPLYERDKRCISCKFARACLSVSSHTALLLSAILDYGKGSRIVENSYPSFSVVYTRLKKMYVGYVTIIHQFVAPKTEQTTKIMKPTYTSFLLLPSRFFVISSSTPIIHSKCIRLSQWGIYHTFSHENKQVRRRHTLIKFVPTTKKFISMQKFARN